MARYTGPACRLCRRAGEKLFLKGERCYTPRCAIERRRRAPGDIPQRRRRISEWGVQLREKQKARQAYGMLERQFRGYFATALRMPGVTGTNLLGSTMLWSDSMRTAVALMVVGGAWWGWFWWRVSPGLGNTAGRRFTLYLFAVLGGATTILVTLAVTLERVLVWAFGAPDIQGAVDHFSFVPGAIASVMVGGMLGLYHWAVLWEEGRAVPVAMAATRRTFRHLVAALGLGAAAIGIVLLIGIWV